MEISISGFDVLRMLLMTINLWQLPKFYNLCGDGVWGVRKACAECFMTISCACSLETRRQYLANLFVDLLADQSRWVRMSAFQQLGPFISTFADPQVTGIYVAEDGSIVLQEGWSVSTFFFSPPSPSNTQIQM